MFHIMRNNSIYGTADLVDRFLETLHEVGPRTSVNDAAITSITANDESDLLLRWHIGGATVDFAVDVKVSPLTATAPRAAREPRGGTLPIVLSPFVPPGVRRQLERDGMSYWDPTGNLLLQSSDPFIWVRREGASKNPNSVAAGAGLRSLKGRSASEVIVHLLANGRAGTVRDLARESGVSLGTASRVVSLLRDEDLLKSTGDGPLVVRDPLRLAQRWTEEYSFAKTYRAKRYFSILGSDVALARLRASDSTYALTGLAAQSLWYESQSRVTPLPSSELWLYTDDVERVERIADLVPDDENGTILVAQTNFLQSGRENYQSVGNIRSARPWRVVGDLMSLSGRYAAAGTDFARELIDQRGGHFA
jgi:hypothetical protein